MKKIFFLLSFLIFTRFAASAQEETEPQQDERIKTLEIAYITKELNLTSEEAEKFWPVFNRYRSEVKAAAQNPAITDPIDRQQRLLDIRKKYRVDFSRILSQDRANKFYASEDRFRDIIRKEIQRRVQRRQELRKGKGF